MLVTALALALQVSVQVETDSGRAQGSISVRPPIRERIPVTAEHRRTAFKDAAARELLLKARAARLQQDSSLYSYDVTSYQRISAGLALRETARDRLMFRAENASRVRWQRGVGARVEVLGARQAVPIVQGLREAEEEMNNELENELDDFLAVPYYPGKDELWLFEMVGESDEWDEDDPMLVHPVAEGSEAYFTFRSGDSITIRLPDGKTITLKEIIATPREAAWNLVVGSFWFETERAHLARAVMRFSAPMDIWEQVERDDPGTRDDIPAPVRGLLTPMRAEITAVTIEYGLFEQRYWLPRTQGAEGYARVGFMRVPLRVEQRYRYASVNGFDDLPPVQWPTGRVSTRVLRDSLYELLGDSALARDSARTLVAQLDSARREARRARCDSVGTYTVYQRRDRTLEMAVEIPCDAQRLATSSELPPSIYDPGEEIFGADDREELMKRLDFGLQPAWSPQRPKVEWGLPFTRYNRVEGLGTGTRVSATLGSGYSTAIEARGSIADLQLNGSATFSRSNGRRELSVSTFRRLAVSSDFGGPLSFGASMPAILYARDEGFYHRAWGAELAGRRVNGGGLEWRLFAEEQWAAPVETRWSLFGGNNDSRFVGNVVADKGWYYGGAMRWRASRGLDPAGWRASADLRLEGATGASDYGRAMLETVVSRGLGPLAASVTAAAGTTEGELPAQRQFFLGGLQSIRGQNAGTQVGESFWMGRLEIGLNRTAFRPVIFGDLGWAGPRDGWTAIGRPMAGVGAGASFLDGLIRFDVSRGMHPLWQTRLDLYLEARF